MGDLLGYLLLNRDFHISEDTPDGEKVCRSLLAYYNTGEGAEEIQNLLSEYRKVIYEMMLRWKYTMSIYCAPLSRWLCPSHRGAFYPGIPS